MIKSLFDKYENTIQERFFKYVRIDTESDPNSSSQPSTEKQKDLGRVLVEELKSLGISDAHLDEYGYVYATIPSNINDDCPVICFCAHMDTSPDCSGKDVKPLLHSNYQGQDIVLPDDSTVVIKANEHPELHKKIGHDLITASGETLLGADNKAGVAAIMEAVRFLTLHPEVKHGKIRILFTPDEEIGRGVDKVDIAKLAADIGYTIDGEAVGSLEDETFSADAAVLRIHGVSAHPGFAKGKLQSAIKVICEIIDKLPKDRLSPETTEGKVGFIHPVSISGSAEKAEASFILRDFNTANLNTYASLISDITKKVVESYYGTSYELEIKEQYRNMKEVLDKNPKIIELAKKAIELAGVKPNLRSIRGGTDGSRLSFMGLPCPNIFAGEHSFHSKQEWCTVQDMLASSQTIVHLSHLWSKEKVVKKSV